MLIDHIKLNTKCYSIVLSISCILFLGSCAEDSKQSSKFEKKEVKEEKAEEKNSNLLEIEGKIFSIPSPIQTAFLLKETGASYQSDLLNKTESASNYSTSASKALNLGIYGADLGYATIFDNTEDAIAYVAVTKRLSNEIGITNLFNESMMQRFENNLGNQDSLLAMVSDAFKVADSYLKNSDQEDLGTLILAGGWIETLHFATKVAELKDSPALKSRIGEQKITISNLINLLSLHANDGQGEKLIEQLTDLKSIYEGISFTYKYVEPITLEEKKTTIIKSESNVEISAEQMTQISQKVSEIRNSIIL